MRWSYYTMSVKFRNLVGQILFALFVAGTSTGASAQTITPENTVLLYPNGGRNLVRVVAEAAISSPTAAAEFMSLAVASSDSSQQAIGAGLARAYRSLIEAEELDHAGQIIATICNWRYSIISASFAGSMQLPLPQICSTAWSFDRRPPPWLVRFKSLAGPATPN
jgi:hypothetical protein